MFQPDPALQHIPATREQVLSIVESINQPQVSLPGKPARPSTGHLCGLRNGNGTFSIYVALHVPSTGENLVYVHDRRQLDVEGYREVEAEALQFLESMGFMLDNLNYHKLAPAQQDEALRRIPALSSSPTRTPVPSRATATATAAATATAPAAAPDARSGAADTGRVARLLASF